MDKNLPERLIDMPEFLQPSSRSFAACIAVNSSPPGASFLRPCGLKATTVPESQKDLDFKHGPMDSRPRESKGVLASHSPLEGDLSIMDVYACQALSN